jgi:hypothetical protein
LNRRPVPVFVIVIVSVIAVILLAGLLPAVTSRAGSSGESIPVGGVFHISVIGPQGNVVRQVTAHNTLYPYYESLIAACFDGAIVGSCSGFTQAITVAWFNGAQSPTTQEAESCGQPGGPNTGPTYGVSCVTEVAGNSLTPSNCSITGNANGGNFCEGWQATASFPSTDFPAAAGCSASCTITAAFGIDGTTFTGSLGCVGNGCEPQGSTYSNNYGNAFDSVSTSIQVSAGDSLQITISYTVT